MCSHFKPNSLLGPPLSPAINSILLPWKPFLGHLYITVQRKHLITKSTIKAHSSSVKTAVTNLTFTVITHNMPQINRHTLCSIKMGTYIPRRRSWLRFRFYTSSLLEREAK